MASNKRPLDSILLEDDSEAEDKKNAMPTKEVELLAEELLQKKKVRYFKPFTEDILTLPDGLQRIYEEFPFPRNFRGKGYEQGDIKQLMSMYREWAFQLHPSLAFTDILNKCEALGSKGKTRITLQDLRERERDRYITKVLHVDINKNESSFKSSYENDRSTSKDTRLNSSDGAKSKSNNADISLS